MIASLGERLFLIGGQGADNYADVWRGDDGSTWTLADSQAPWAPRAQFAGVAAFDRIYILGGVRGPALDDSVWYYAP